MTPRQQVLRRYPNARSYQWGGAQGWVIYSGGCVLMRGRRKTVYNFSFTTGSGSAKQAWERAAKNMRSTSRLRRF